jgi:hypothetical protein
MWPSNSSFWKLLLIAVATTTVLSIGRQSAEGQQSTEEAELRGEEQQYIAEMYANVSRFLTAKKSRDAGALSLQLFRTPFDVSVGVLSTHENPNIAIQAAWRRYSRMVRSRDVYFGSRNASLDPRDVQRFLGFVEGRSHVLVPKWWEHALANPEENLPHKKRLRDYWLALDETVKKSDDSHVTLEINSEQIKVPARTFESLHLRSDKRLGVQMDEKHLLMMPHRSDAGGVRIACVDLARSKEVWQADIWGLGDLGGRTGHPLEHFMTMKISRKNIFVFGATRQGVYVEAFTLTDGAPLIRFATTNWFVEAAQQGTNAGASGTPSQ